MEDRDLRKLIDRQMELEGLGLSRGMERYRRRMERSRLQGKGSEQGGARKLLVESIGPLVEALEDQMGASLRGWAAGSRKKRGAKHCALPWVERAGVEVTSYLTAKVLLDGVALRMPVARAALRISALILDELRFRKMAEEAPGLLQHAMARFNTLSYAHKSRSLTSALSYAEIDLKDLDMDTGERMKVGVFLIDRFIQSTGLFRIENSKIVKKGVGGRRNQVRQEKHIVAEPETLEWMAKRDAFLMTQSMENPPMVMEPLPWGPRGSQRGGYRFALRGKHGLVRRGSKEQKATLKSAEMPVVYEALNAIQSTPWRINKDVLDTLTALEERGGGIGPVPRLESLPLPPRPIDIDTNPEARKAWKKRAGKVRDADHRRKVEVIGYMKTLAAAREVAEDERIYFPHNLDFRGRIYPISTYLSPQGSDLDKGLLEFAEGRELGTYGAFWLCVHGANCYGQTPGGRKVSTMTLEERREWIVSVHDDLLAVSRDPVGTVGFWGAADEPLQFLAFCFEFGRCQRHFEQEGKLDSFVSHLPVSVDGTCNGLQHLAAIFKDPVGAAAVNVLPSDRPQDVYATVAEAVLDELERRAPMEEVARLWLTSGLVNRKLTKRPVMTVGYGSKVYGFGQQIIEYLKGLDNWQEVKEHFTVRTVDPATGEEREKSLVKPAAHYMANAIWSALGVTVKAAVEGMGWMQDSARTVARSGKPVGWKVPLTGFPVVQHYHRIERKRVETMLAGSLYRPSLQVQCAEVDPRKQASAVAPNIVHSLDAAVLMLTVSSGSREGISSWAMVHDSYGCLAGDMELLSQLLRRAFVRLYSQDVADVLFGSFLRAAEDPEEIQDPSAYQGTLDIGAVHASAYFFA